MGALKSPILHCLVGRGNRIEFDNSFDTVHSIPAGGQKKARFHNLSAADTIDIRLIDPAVCTKEISPGTLIA